MALNVSADLVPTGGGSWPTHSDTYGKGGYRAVADNTARDAIPTLRRSEGMLVYVLATGFSYRLGAGLGNGDWVLQSSGTISAGNGLTGTTMLSVLANGASIEVSASGIRRAALTGAISAAAGSNATAFASGDFGALNLNTTGFLTMAATPAGSGNIRWGSDTSYSIMGRTALGADRIVLQWDPTTPRIALGANDATVPGHVYLTGSGVQLRYGSDYVAQALNGSFQLNGGVFLTMTAGNAMNIRVLDSNGAGATGGAMNTRAGDATSGAGGGNGGARFDRAGNATGASGTRVGGDYDLQAGGGGTTNGTLSLRAPDATGALGTKRIAVDGTGIGFFNAAPIAKPAVTGSRGGNAALASLLTELANLGLITDSTTA